MDVERGRTVKGWRPRRLGECIQPMPGLGRSVHGGFVLPSFVCTHFHFLSSLLLAALQLLTFSSLGSSSFTTVSWLVSVLSFWVTKQGRERWPGGASLGPGARLLSTSWWLSPLPFSIFLPGKGE